MLQKATPPLIRFKMAISNGRFSMPNNKEETGETEELKIRKSGQGRGVEGSKFKTNTKKRSTFRQNNEHRFGVGFPGTKLQLNSIDLNFGLGRFSYFRAYSQGSVPR